MGGGREMICRHMESHYRRVSAVKGSAEFLGVRKNVLRSPRKSGLVCARSFAQVSKR